MTTAITGISCGHCKGRHASVAEVRACSGTVTTARNVDVPAGRYALESDGIVKFYKIDRPEDGKWAGYTFVKLMASDDEYPVRDRRRREEILAAIAVDVWGASTRYGQEIGSCGVCGRTLTDAESRAAGIGPVCAAKF